MQAVGNLTCCGWKCFLFRYHKFKQSYSSSSRYFDTVCTPSSKSTNSSLVISLLPRWNMGRSHSYSPMCCVAEGSAVAATPHFIGK